MYELFVLGQLMDAPQHGYLLHSIIKTAIGPVRQMSWGALYPLIRRLEQDGFIAPDGDGSADDGGRRRKLYRITDAGRERFCALMLEPAEYNVDYPDLFSIKMANFDHITRAQQLVILHQYRDYLGFLQNYMQTAHRRVAAQPEIPEPERPYILRVIEHRLHVTAADLAWIEAEIARVAAEESAKHAKESAEHAKESAEHAKESAEHAKESAEHQ